MVACAKRLKEAFPEVEIRAFAMVRTLGFLPLTDIVTPVSSVINYYQSGKTFRQDPEEN